MNAPLTEDQWLARYKQRFVDVGLTHEEAQACAEAIDMTEVDLSDDDPEQMADDEMSYWDDDGHE